MQNNMGCRADMWQLEAVYQFEKPTGLKSEKSVFIRNGSKVQEKKIHGWNPVAHSAFLHTMFLMVETN